MSCQNEIFSSLSSELLNVARGKMEQNIVKMFDVNGKCIGDGKCWNPYSWKQPAWLCNLTEVCKD